METIRIKYFTDQIEKLTYIAGKSDWIDLRAAQEITLKAGEFKLTYTANGYLYIARGYGMQDTGGYSIQVAV